MAVQVPDGHGSSHHCAISWLSASWDLVAKGAHQAPLSQIKIRIRGGRASARATRTARAGATSCLRVMCVWVPPAAYVCCVFG